MRTGRLVMMSIRGLSAYKMRTFLMMLGIVIGIATLTVMVSLGKGAQKKIMKGISNFGPNAIMVQAGGGKIIGPSDERSTTLTLDDAEAIRDSVGGIRHIAPFIQKTDQSVVYEGRSTMTSVLGATPEWEDAWEWHAELGEFISEEDVAGMSKVCVLGTTAAAELFGGQDPVGESVRIGNSNFRVISILTSRGMSPMGTDMDNRVVIPLSTAMRRVFNVDYVSGIRLYAESPAVLETASAELSSLLRERHHITPPEEDDFRVINSIAIARFAKGVSNTMTTFLGILALVSLVAGGIVIANIMFIAVNERKKEIGIKRAFGARAKDILAQFLCEALMITLAGGAVGTLLGLVLSYVIASIKKMPPVVSWEPFVLAFLFSSAVGILSGIQPARKAASLDPVQAIRD